MESLLINGGGSEILEILLDDDICDQYDIIDWKENYNDYSIMVYFKDINNKFNFQCDYNINLEEEAEGYIRKEYIAR